MDGTDKKGVTNFHASLLINTSIIQIILIKNFCLETFDLKNETIITEDNLLFNEKSNKYARRYYSSFVVMQIV